MPSTDKTFRDLNKLHLVFGISSVVMLIATIWVLAADHNREWKPYAKKAREIATAYDGMQIAEQRSLAYEKALSALKRRVAEARRIPPSADDIDQFKTALKTYWTSVDELKIEHQFNAETAFSDLDQLIEELSAAREKADSDGANIPADEIINDSLSDARDAVIAEMNSLLGSAVYVEERLNVRLKEQLAARDAAGSKQFEANRDGKASQEHLDELQGNVKSDVADGNELKRQSQELEVRRIGIEKAIRAVTLSEITAAKDLDAHRATVKRMHSSYEEKRSTAWKRLIELPIVDAFNSPLKIQQIWLPDLTKNINLADVARFDRCTTCHRMMDKSKPGQATEPAFPRENNVAVALPTPTAKSKETAESDHSSDLGDPPDVNALLNLHYGFVLYDRGLLSESEAAIVVYANTTAARIGLRTADVITEIGGVKITDREAAVTYLLESVTWGKPLSITVRRGLPHPYSAHPRLDLIGASTSPHPFGTFGCSICHQGKGGATAFQEAVHTPNTHSQELAWETNHKWSDYDHYWDFPQLPKRFLQSSCLKCHHDVTELEASEKFPDPPAPKVVGGFHLVRRFGCFGCHEIKGFDGPIKRIGPDLRLEPNFYTVGAKLTDELKYEIEAVNQRIAALKEPAQAAAHAVVAEVARHAARVRVVPEDDQARHRLAALLQDDAQRAELKRTIGDLTSQIDGTKSAVALDALQKNLSDAKQQQTALLQESSFDEPIFSPEAHRLVDELNDVESPGRQRKVGPSFRYLSSKLDEKFLYWWIKDPKAIRPETRMPRVFGHREHLEGDDLADADRYETVEIRAIAAYLLEQSKTNRFEYEEFDNDDAIVPIEDEDGLEEQQIRGREFFATKGCMACHSVKNDPKTVEMTQSRQQAWKDAYEEAIEDNQSKQQATEAADEAAVEADDEDEFPHVTRAFREADQDQGPDLSGLLAKFVTADPEDSANYKSQQQRARRWLYTWIRNPGKYHPRTKMPNLFIRSELVEKIEKPSNPEPGAAAADTDPPEKIDPGADLVEYLMSLTGADLDPVPALNPKDLEDLTRLHLMSKYRKPQTELFLKRGIPESMRKSIKGDEVELLASSGDQTAELAKKKLLYVGRRSISKYGCYACHDIPGYETAKPIGTTLADWGRKEVSKLDFGQISTFLHSHGNAGHAGAHGKKAHKGDTEQAKSEEYFQNSVSGHKRIGFLWQKLRQPRSYDYRRTDAKTYNEWLRMPKFNLTAEQSEQIMTFILGLVSEPPPKTSYIYKPTPHRKAIIEGERVLAKFNCGGCHVLKPDRLTIAFAPPAKPVKEDDSDESPVFPEASDPFKDYEFLRKHYTSAQIAQSLTPDFAGRRHAQLIGLQSRVHQDEDEKDARLKMHDSEGAIFDPVESEGEPLLPFQMWKPALINGQVFYPSTIEIPSSTIVRRDRAVGGTAARLMIPILHERIKPELSTLTGDGAWALVPPPLIGEGRKVQSAWLYDFLLEPHEIRPAVRLRMPKFNMSPDEARKLVAYFAAVDQSQHPYKHDARVGKKFVDKVKVDQPKYFDNGLKLVVKGICGDCHRVGDYTKGGNLSGLAPNLEMVDRRLRRDYLRKWIAQPTSQLPYTAMPVNFAHGAKDHQKFIEGSGQHQINVLVDTLLNYSHLMKTKASQSAMRAKFDAEAPAPKVGAPPDDTNQ